MGKITIKTFMLRGMTLLSLKAIFDVLGNLNRILETISGMEVDAVDIDKFRKFVKKHPALLFPAFEMQRKMQKHTLGVSYWRRLADKRLKLSSGQFVPIKKFMEMHLEKLAAEDKSKTRFSTKNIRLLTCIRGKMFTPLKQFSCLQQKCCRDQCCNWANFERKKFGKR
jgi:hypothetical protein